jgi:hypothetical protein
MINFSNLAGVECLPIAATVRSFSSELKWNDLYYHLSKAL